MLSNSIVVFPSLSAKLGFENVICLKGWKNSKAIASAGRNIGKAMENNLVVGGQCHWKGRCDGKDRVGYIYTGERRTLRQGPVSGDSWKLETECAPDAP